jgi:IS30 family transposase
MENGNNRYWKHLTLQDRYDIEDGLNQSHTLTKIADLLRKDKGTISKEIRKHRIGDTLRVSGSNDCMNKYRCPIRYLCPDCVRDIECHNCRKADCRNLCLKYRSSACKYTSRAPYVCNGCSLIYDCKQPHFFYRANTAHTAYLEQLKASREGIGLSRQQLYELDCLLTPLIQQGQSIAHIYNVHKDEIPCSIKTIYNYIDQGIFTARNIDLPKKVKYKARKKCRKESEINYAYREGRTYKDFQMFLAEVGDGNVVEMDTVHGNRASGKVMLTMLFRNSSLMLIFLLEECSQKCVGEVFDRLTELLGVEGFRKSFPVILTDNGSEFKNPLTLEKTLTGENRTKIFYCDPLASWQKARLEKNHEYIRKVILSKNERQKSTKIAITARKGFPSMRWKFDFHSS